MSIVRIKHSEEQDVPVHVAIIMDGNGRWAKARNLPRTAGHQRGAESVKTAIKSAAEIGVSYLTLWVFTRKLEPARNGNQRSYGIVALSSA